MKGVACMGNILIQEHEKSNDMLKSIDEILNRGNDVEIRKNGNGKIAVMEVAKKKKYVIE